MSRFADPTAVTEVNLGPCECPGTPHGSDLAYIRSQFSARELVTLGAEIRRLSAMAEEDEDAMVSDALIRFVVSWNLLGPDGQPSTPTRDLIYQLTTPTLTTLIEAVTTAVSEAEQLPNPSSALSAASSPESASPTPQ